MAAPSTFLDAMHYRRSIYQLNNTSPISDDQIVSIANSVIQDVPSSFNSQSTRLVVLLHDEHVQFWNIVLECLRAIVPEGAFLKTEKRIAGFRNSYGTILFYEDEETIKDLQAEYELYAERFPQWGEHTSGMHQYALWVALEAEGLGANIQHYNPLVDQQAAIAWEIPENWQLKAQLIFGGCESAARESLPPKTQRPVEARLSVHGSRSDGVGSV
ncbi:hypothetical protein LT330_008949 [Penicillium expansum]|uniref:Nitroreductase domain-containing protein n=1 Tax=Penicillium expansum TaxID=27334 RepID=A0A0A2JD36_PENEN|nr:hypothetical protein PEX2_084070 [Penicillium expansum]KAK4865856.1 hypothetical protein LT330_008949 [Penicillium expansum]KGO43665.1 hypothetical protein PEXP_095670 [Penicillium expansum]KGO52691.1 hypothetical protein PEX2_084070 [Penicillium expansum]